MDSAQVAQKNFEDYVLLTCALDEILTQEQKKKVVSSRSLWMFFYTLRPSLSFPPATNHVKLSFVYSNHPDVPIPPYACPGQFNSIATLHPYTSHQKWEMANFYMMMFLTHDYPRELDVSCFLDLSEFRTLIHNLNPKFILPDPKRFSLRRLLGTLAD